MVVLNWIYLSKNGSQGIIPKLIGLLQVSWSEPEVANIISVLNLGECILACLAVFKLVIDSIILMDNILDEILCLLYSFGLLSKLPKDLLVMLSKLLSVFFLIFLSQHLFTSISGYLIFYSVAFVCLGLEEIFLLCQETQSL